MSGSGSLPRPLAYEPRQLPQRLALAAEGRERLLGKAEQLGFESLGARDAEELHEGDLAGVLPHVLARLLGRAQHVEQVVRDLEGEAEVLGEAGDDLEILA